MSDQQTDTTTSGAAATRREPRPWVAWSGLVANAYLLPIVLPFCLIYGYVLSTDMGNGRMVDGRWTELPWWEHLLLIPAFLLGGLLMFLVDVGAAVIALALVYFGGLKLLSLGGTSFFRAVAKVWTFLFVGAVLAGLAYLVVAGLVPAMLGSLEQFWRDTTTLKVVFTSVSIMVAAGRLAARGLG